MLSNLQAARALAAIGVVIFHFGLMPATSLAFTIGASGVDLFFVLSGFIIAHSSARSARHFLIRRLIRVIPAYWIATLIAALVTLQSLAPSDAFDWLVQSLFYLPGPEGRPALIFVAWTLVYELAFYLLYRLALAFGARAAPLLALGLLLMLALIELPGLPGPWPLLLEFALGVGIYLAVERYQLPNKLLGAPGLVLALVGLTLLLTLPGMMGYDPDDYDSVGRVLNWGVPAAAIILGLVVAEQGGFAVRNRLILLLGAASYAIYLLHPIALGQLMQLPANPPPFSWALCLLALAVTVLLSVAFHLLIEVPLLRTLRGWLGRKAPVEQSASGALSR